MTTATLLAFSALAPAFGAPTAAPRLYDELGGVHKIAAAVDAAFDLEAKDETLLANDQFRWLVEKLGPAPTKFMVVNSICSATGGPQKPIAKDILGHMAWLDFTPRQLDRAWELRMKGMTTAGIPMEAQAKLRMWLDDGVKRAKPMMPEPESFADKGSLYARLGGFAPIAMVVDTFVNELASDPVVMANPNVVDSLTKGPATGPGIKYLVTEQLVAAAGGPIPYSGREMKSSHAGLGITAKEWDAAAAILVRVLDQYKVPKKEQGEILSVVGSTRGDIVKK